MTKVRTADKGKPIKNGSRVIGYVATRPAGPLGYYWASEVLEDGGTRHMGGAGTQGAAIRMLRERDDRKTIPKRPWHVRTANGSQCIVEASTEGEAWEVARYLLKRWAQKAFEPVNARVADDGDTFEAAPGAIQFGEMKSAP